LLDIAEEFCDKYIILGKGKVIASGTKKEILREYHFSEDTSLEKIYLFLNEREG
jgi:ABC-2 type transport system ATP-binding protein